MKALTYLADSSGFKLGSIDILHSLCVSVLYKNNENLIV